MVESRGGRVLIVNDDPRLVESVRTLLADEGYEVRTACDGRAALEALSGYPADLILLDLIMPRIDGWEFLMRRAANRDLMQSHVVVWSVAPPEDLERARKLGADSILSRHATDPDRLLSTIRQAMTARPIA
jgi:CheY-like chemotaxis protein